MRPIPISLLERGELRSRQAVAKAGGMPQDVARLQLDDLRKGLQWKRGAAGDPRHGDVLQHERITELSGSGNVVCAVLEYENITEVVTSVGDRGKGYSAVAREVVDGVRAYCDAAHGAPVDEFLADQLILPMALGAGGSFRGVVGSLHMTTNAALINRFLGPDTVTWSALPGGGIVVEVKGCFDVARSQAARVAHSELGGLPAAGGAASAGATLGGTGIAVGATSLRHPPEAVAGAELAGRAVAESEESEAHLGCLSVGTLIDGSGSGSQPGAAGGASAQADSRSASSLLG